MQLAYQVELLLLVFFVVAGLGVLFWMRAVEKRHADLVRKVELLRGFALKQSEDVSNFSGQVRDFQVWTQKEFQRFADAVTVVEEALGLDTGHDEEGRENGHA